MSETPSETDHIDHAEEPSMEDILASIRKIIADDDQNAESAAPEAAIAAEGLNSRGYASEALVTGSFGRAPIEANRSALAAARDKNSVFKDLRGPSGLDDILNNDFDSDEDFVDLDIEALLNQADAPLETFDDTLDDAVSDDGDLMDILAMEIPNVDSELRINPATRTETGAVLSTGGASASLAETNLDFSSESVAQPQIDTALDNEVDSFIDDLDSLLSDDSEAFENDDLDLTDFVETEQVPEPIIDRTARKGLLGAGLAAVGFGAKARQKSAQADFAQTSKDETSSMEALTGNADDDLDAMLETLIGDIDLDDDSNNDEEASLAEPIKDDDIFAERPSLKTDDEEMDLVKSLMADLTDPESEAPELGALEIDAPDVVSAQSASLTASEESFGMDDDDNSDFDIEALLNGDVKEDEIDDLLSGETGTSETELTTSNVLAEADGDEMDNILNDILDMSLEDELSGHEDDIESLLEIPEPESTDRETVFAEGSNSFADPVTPQAEQATELPFELSEDDILPDAGSVFSDEIENLTLNDSTIKASEPPVEEKSSLLEIAMEAEKDADIIEAQTETELVSVSSPELQSDAADLQEPISETDVDTGSIAAVTGIGLAAVAAAASVSVLTETQDKDAPVVEDVTPQGIESVEMVSQETLLEDVSDATVDIEEPSSYEEMEDVISTPTPPQTKQTIQKETANMPSAAAKSDTILDEVTTNSTAEVFASLNQVVEEKAIVAERGDRVGDLVMEALRPMLKDWLDENLKGIVERAVAKEVKRISSAK